MYSSQRLIAAIGELSDEKIEKAGVALGYRGGDRTGASFRLSRWLGIAAAVMMVLALSAVAYPVYVHWSRGMEQILPANGEEQEYAKDSGLSESIQFDSLQNETVQTARTTVSDSAETESMKVGSAQIVSSTVNGVTVSVEQTVIDSNTARIALRIDGFITSYGDYPDIGAWQLTFDGEVASNMTGGFAESRDAEGNLIFADKNGVLEYDFYASDSREDYSFTGKQIYLRIDSLGTGDKARYESLVEGPWELCWTPAVNQEIRSIQTDTPIGETGIRLLSAEIAPVSARITMKLDEFWEGYKTLESFDWQLVGVRLKDGTELVNIFGPPVYVGYADLDNLILELHYSAHQIIHPEQVEALLFAGPYPWAKTLTEEDLIIVD